MPMSPSAAAPWLIYWYAALSERTGIWLRTLEPSRMTSRLYAARTAAHDPQLDALTIRTSPADPDHELWIVRTSSPEPVA